MNKLLILIFFVFTLNANALEKKTTFDKELFNQAQSEGKIVVVSSWIKYCQSCAGQMKILNKAKEQDEQQKKKSGCNSDQKVCYLWGTPDAEISPFG